MPAFRNYDVLPPLFDILRSGNASKIGINKTMVRSIFILHKTKFLYKAHRGFQESYFAPHLDPSITRDSKTIKIKEVPR